MSLTARILTAAREVDRALRAQNSLTLLGALNDVKGQVAGLVFSGFVSRTGVTRLAQLPRYLQGALDRVRGLADNPGRDRQRMTEFERVAALYAEAGGVVPAPRRRAALARPRAVAARGVPGEPVRAGTRHRRARVAAANSEGAAGIAPRRARVAPAMAKAIVYTEFGGPEVLQLIEVPDPVPGEGEVAIHVEAAGVNPIEWKLRSGLRPSGPIDEPRRVGGDGAGVVTAVGGGRRRIPPGRRGRLLRRVRRLRDRCGRLGGARALPGSRR